MLMTRGTLWLRALAVVAALLVADAVYAQTYQATMRGSVRDAEGVLPGAEVSLVNQETQAARTVVTNSSGEFVFASVLPGTYTAKVTLAGFRTEERRDISIATQQTLVSDFTLAVGGVTEQVTVTAEAPLVERASATVAVSLSSAQISALPIFGRNTFYSAISTPSVVQSGDPQFVRYQDQSNASLLSLGGGPRRGNAYLLEGVSITDFVNRASWVPSTEAIADMRVQTKTYDADMGRAAGGVFNVTARSGSNSFRGSALFVTKPDATTGQLFFAKRDGLPKTPQSYYGWAGSIGGPIVTNKTFFWFSKDDYYQESSRNNQLTFPTPLERMGDFSQSFNSAGQLRVIYDPLTTRPNPSGSGFIRDPFPGNVIPAGRLDPVARAMMANMPTPGSGQLFNGQASLEDGPQRQETLKVDHRWSDAFTTSGMYGHQYTKEPGSAFWGPHGEVAGDPGGSTLYRTVHFISVNNVFVPSNTMTVAVRYGYNTFFDDGGNFLAFDAGTLGFPESHVNAMPFNTFPSVSMTGYSGLGNGGPNPTTHVGQTANITVSKLLGNHSLKFGGDYRRIAAETDGGSNAGSYAFTQGFTQGPTPTTAGAASGDSVASFLLGYAGSGSISVGTPATYLVDYFSAYVQDEFRLSSALTLNFGLRWEYEAGVREKNNQVTVGFDRDAAFPEQVAGLDLKGGLMYAGTGGYGTTQGNPLNGLAPRGGFAWSLSPKTVVRGGYGFYWVPQQIAGVGEAAIGSRGYTAVTDYLASTDGNLTPAGVFSNPFQSGITPPQGNALGLMTGAGGNIDFVEQNSRAGHVQQYSLDVARELGGSMMLSVGYMGSRSERLSMGGTADATVNINQLDPEYQALGTALQALVPNPFYGNPAFGNLSLSPTISRGQLLRPYPQFQNVLAHRVNEASARYNAMVTQWVKRMSNGYSLNVNYTFAQLEDNQYGEGNSFSSGSTAPLNNYDLDAEYGLSTLDIRHRLNVNATFQLPFGEGHRWLNDGGVAGAILGDWQFTVAGRYQTGFPIRITQSSNNSGLLGSGQRPNVVPGVEVMTTGSQEERGVTGWINPAAFTSAAAFTFGDAPRTNGEWRGPGQRTTDVAISKTFRFGSKTLSVRADVLNIFDDPLFNGPNTSVGSQNFGQITSVGGFARSMQFQIRAGW
jgi:hypothetical protein